MTPTSVVVVPFQPAPYWPSEKMPTHRTPNRPPTPWTPMAPTGSSMPRRSMKPMASMTMTAARMPMTAAAQGCTKAQGAVIATRPASMPLTIIPGSGLPTRFIIQNIAAVAPKAAARAVFRATTAKRTSVTAKVEAALKPNQPNSRMNVPSMAIGMWWPGIGLAEPSLLNFPMRGPSTMAPARAAMPPTACTTPEPAKST